MSELRKPRPRIEMTREDTATVPFPADMKLIAPAHWSPATVEDARKSAWAIYYGLDDAGQSWVDWERYAHAPDSLGEPSAEVIAAHAPEWFNTSDYRRASASCGHWFGPAPVTT